MAGKRKNSPDQPELPIGGEQASSASGEPAATSGEQKAGNGTLHVQAEVVETPPHRPFVPGKSGESLLISKRCASGTRGVFSDLTHMITTRSCTTAARTTPSSRPTS